MEKRSLKKWEIIGIAVICILFLIQYRAASSDVKKSRKAVEKAASDISWEIGTAASLQEAKTLARSEAEKQLKNYNNISEIKTRVVFYLGSTTWENGQYAKVIVSARIRTANPFRSVKKKAGAIFMIDNVTEGLLMTAPAAGKKDPDDRDWMEVLNDMEHRLIENGFTYGSSPRSTYERALKKDKTSNCSKYVSWCLQEYGAIPKGETFWYLNGLVGGDVLMDNPLLDVSFPDVEYTELDLKRGDICCFQINRKVGHVAVYLGKEKGKTYWLTAGKDGTTEHHKNGGTYNGLKRTQSYYHKVKVLIRVKDKKENKEKDQNGQTE